MSSCFPLTVAAALGFGGGEVPDVDDVSGDGSLPLGGGGFFAVPGVPIVGVPTVGAVGALTIDVGIEPVGGIGDCAVEGSAIVEDGDEGDEGDDGDDANEGGRLFDTIADGGGTVGAPARVSPGFRRAKKSVTPITATAAAPTARGIIL